MPIPARARSVAKAAAAREWDGGPAWDPVKTAMRTPLTLVGRAARPGIGTSSPGSSRKGGRRGSYAPSSGVGQGDPLGDADRLVAALALDGDGEGVLQTAGDLLHVLERHPRPDLG